MYFSGEAHSGSQWISDNLSITGFTVAHAAFMTVKELAENAVDASRSVHGPAISIHLEIGSDCVEVSCTDNGNGFGVNSVQALTRVFQSARSSEADASVGKFGIGLKAMALMSHSKCQGAKVSVTSGIRGTPTSVTFMLYVDQGGAVAISEPVPVDSPGQNDCTKVTVVSPCPPDLDSFKQDLGQYLSELALQQPSLTLTLSINDEDPDTIAAAIDGPKPVVYSDPSGLLSCSVSVVTKTSETKCVRLVRSVNGVPLITANSASCILRQASFGTVLKLASSMGIDLEGEITEDSVVSSAMKVRGAPQGSSWTELVVRVNATISSADVEYTCLSKDGVTGSKSQTLSVPLVARTVRSALKRTQARFRTQFQSNEEFERKLAISKHIPVIAHHLAQISLRVSDPTIKDKITALFTSDDRESELKHKLIYALTTSLQL